MDRAYVTGNAACTEKRDSGLQALREGSNRLADRLEGLVARAQTRLEPVMLQLPETPRCPVPVSRSFAPGFAEIGLRLARSLELIDALESVIDRVDV